MAITWLELMDVLDRMPRHLLKQGVELWHYDGNGDYDILPVDEIVSPLNDSGSDEDWGPGGDCHLSLQSYDEERETDKTYTFTFTRAQMRESAAASGHVLTDEQCDTLAGYASMDVVDEDRMGRYLSFGLQD